MTDAWQNDPPSTTGTNVVPLNPWDRDKPVSPGPTIEQRAAVASSDNGDEAARALRIGRKTGINPAVVQTDIEGYDAHARAQDAKKATENPFITDYLNGNPFAASVSGDDYDALQRSSEAVQAITPDNFNGRSALSTVGKILTTTLGTIPEAAARGAKEGIGQSPGPTGVSNEFIQAMQTAGIFRKPGQDYQGLQFLNEAAILPAASAINTFFRGFTGALYGAGEAAKQASLELGDQQGEAERLKREVINFGVFLMSDTPIKPVAHPMPAARMERLLTTEEFLGRVQAMTDREAIDAFIKSKDEHKPLLMITKAEDAAAGLDKAIEVAQDSKTKQRDPELFRDSVAAHDPGELHIDAAKVAELYQREGKVPAPDDGLLGFVPGLAEKVESAAATGGEVTVPVADYIAHVDPTVHAGLKDVVRLHNDGVTLAEAKEVQETPPPSDKLYHGSLTEGIDTFRAGSHFGTIEAAKQRIKDLQELPDESRDFGQPNKADEKPTLYEVIYPPRNTVRLSDNGEWSSPEVAQDMYNRGLISEVEFRRLEEGDFDFDPFEYLASKGYDAIEYKNEHEAKGSTSYILLKDQPVNRVVPIDEIVETTVKKKKNDMFLHPLFESGEVVGITEPEFKKYSDKIDRMNEMVLDRAVKVNRDKIAQALTSEWKRQEAATRAEVEADVAERGPFAAEKFLRENKIELGGDNIDAIADELAPLFGFRSGDDLRRSLTDLETVQAADNKSVRKQKEEFIKAETARRMEERHGRLAEKIAEEASEIALAQHTFDILADEVRILAAANGTAPAFSRDDMVSWAKGRFEQSAITDAANLDKLQRAVAKGGREAEKALLSGDYAEAFAAKQRQFLAAVVAKESMRLQKLIDRTEAKIDRFTSEQVIESIDQTYLEAIREMLASVGVAQVHAPVAPPVPLRDLINESQDQLAVAPWLADAPKKLTDMTVEEFRAFADSLKSMEHVGRAAKHVSNAHKEATIQNVIFDVKKQQERFPFIDQPTGANKSLAQRAASTWRYVVGSHLLVEKMFDYSDKFDPHGPLTTWIDRPLRDSNVKEIQLTEMISKQLRDMKGLVDASILDPIPNNIIPDALSVTGFMKMNRGNLREVMLNMGNRSNMQKLVEGFNVDEMSLRRWVDQHATKQDVAYVNAVWKIFDTLKPEADAMQLRDTGVPVDSIPAVASEIKAGKLTGGYYPIVYHKYNSDIMGHRAAMDPVFDQHYVAATTPNGYTKERTEYKGALDLSGAFLASRIRGQIHDIAFREAVRNANKLISNQEFRTALAQRWGTEVVDLLPGWIRNIANSHNLDSDYAQGIARSMALIRQNVISTLIAFNPSTFIKHGFTAAVMSAYRVGGKEIVSALTEVGLKDLGKTAKDLVVRDDIIPDQAYIDAFRDAMDQGQRGESVRQFVLQSSAVMRNRSRKTDDSIRGAIEKLNEIGASGAFMNLRDKNMLWGRLAVAYSDQLSAVPTWWAAYKHAFEKGESHADAVFIADKEVSRAHGSSFTGDQPRVTMIDNSVAGEFLKFFTPLYKFYNHFVNNNFQFVWDSKAYLTGRPEPGANASQLSKYVALALGTLVIESLAKPALDKDKKGILHELLMGAIHLFGGGFIGAREVTSYISHGGVGPGSGLVGTIVKAGEDSVKDLAKQTSIKAGVAKDAIKHTATSIGFLLGLGGAQVGRTGQFITNVARGRDRPRTFDQWRQGLRTGSSKARIH